MSESLFQSSTIFLVMALSSVIPQTLASERSPVLIADKTYDGRAAMLGSMPTRFEATGTFKTSQVTAMCPEATKYVKSYEGVFLSHVDKVETSLRSPTDEWRNMGDPYLEFILEHELCRKLEAGASINIVGAHMNLEGCHAAWETPEYNIKYPGTHSFACFYYPPTDVDGKILAVPSKHLIGFDDWASEEWKKHN